ncbi:MAG: S-layer homology domain-containing protein [Phascolarctobacterium sp.]|nr:S-layer homology domain-containing protein [Phascolarctobacterium sp.]
MKKSLVLAMAMALGVTASAYAANPFSDVPAGHWAYDSVAKLAAAGVVDGYADGAFDGDKLMTRYEMAQIVAKAMAKGANVDKLAAEFADELDTLGVRVAKLEKGADAVKVTGNIRYHYAHNDGDFNGNANNLRSRIYVKGQINDDWTYTGMLENNQNFDNDNGDEDVKFQRAYVNGKIGGLKVQAGRYSALMAEGNVYDTRFDGVQVEYGKDVKLVAGYGKATPSSVGTLDIDLWDKDGVTGKVDSRITREADEAMYVEASTKIGVVGLTAGYYQFNDIETQECGDTQNAAKAADIKWNDYDSQDDDIFAISANFPLAKDLKFGAMYLKGDEPFKDYQNIELGDDDGYVLTLAYKGAKATVPGSWGLTAKYYDQGYSTYVDHTMNGAADKMLGFKGWGLFANYALAKNIVAQVEWYDLEEKSSLDRENETLWTQVVFTF